MATKKKLIFTPPVKVSDKITIQRRGRYLAVWNEVGFRPKRKRMLKQIKNRVFTTDKGIIEERYYIVEGWEPYEEVSKEKS